MATKQRGNLSQRVAKLESKMSVVETQIAALSGLPRKLDQVIAFFDGLSNGIARVSQQQVVVTQRNEKLEADVRQMLDVAKELVDRMGGWK